jgi:hypothetical protein
MHWPWCTARDTFGRMVVPISKSFLKSRRCTEPEIEDLREAGASSSIVLLAGLTVS